MRTIWILIWALLLWAAPAHAPAAVVHSLDLDKWGYEPVWEARSSGLDPLLQVDDAVHDGSGAILLARRGGHRGGHHGFRGHRGFKGHHFRGHRNFGGHRHFRSHSSFGFGFGFFAPFYGSTYYSPFYRSSCTLYSPYYGYYRAPYYYCY